jgi:hypothetical protein
MTATATRTEPGPPGERSIAWYAVVVAVVAVLAVALPLLVTAHYGALRVPRSDAWSYLDSLFRWADGGRLTYNNWASMTLIGQLLLALPVAKVFTDSILAIDVFVAILGGIGLVATAAVGRRLGLPVGACVLVVATIALGPLWGPLATNFMTDVPAFAVQTVALWIGVRAYKPSGLSRGLLVLAVAVALLGVAVRQYAAVTLVALLATAAWHTIATRDDRGRRVVIGAVIGSAVVGVVMYLWWKQVPDRLVLNPRVPSSASIERAVSSAGGFLRLTALLLLPVIVWANPVAIVRRARAADEMLSRWFAAVTVAVLAVAYLVDSSRPFVGNYVDRRGVLSDDIIHGTRPLVMSSVLFDALVVVASIGAVVLTLAMVPWVTERLPQWRERRVELGDPVVLLVGSSIALTAIGLELAILVRLPIFDRYALGAIPLVGLLLLRSVRVRAATPAADASTGARRSTSNALLAWTAVALVAIAGLGVTFTAESASYDAARWRVAQAAVAAGYSPRDVDAGYEWGGWVRGVAPPYLPADTASIRLDKKRRYLAGTCLNVIVGPRTRPANAVAAMRAVGPLRRPVFVAAVPSGRPCADGRKPPGRATPNSSSG